MKKLKRLVCILLMVMCLSLLTGCFRFSTTVEVKRNGKADITIVFASVDPQSDNSDDSDEDDEDMRKQLEDEGWDYEVYNEDGYSGYKITKTNVNLKDLAKEMNSGDDSKIDVDADKLKVEKHGFRYKVSWDVTESDGYEDSKEYGKNLSTYGGYAKFVVKLPYKPISSNAHKVSNDGKTLTWYLFDLEQGEAVELEFSLVNWQLIIGLLVGLIVVVAAVVVIVIILRKKKKNAQGVPPQGFDQSQRFNQSQGYAYPSQDYSPQGYTYPSQDYSPQGYTQPQQYTQPQGYAQPQGYTQPQDGYVYDPNQIYNQDAYNQDGYNQGNPYENQ